MSDNPFKKFVNSLETEEDEIPFSRYGLRDIKVETWDGEAYPASWPDLEEAAEYLQSLQDAWDAMFDELDEEDE